MNFTERLRELRLELNLSQKDVAEGINIPQTTYSDYEKGKTDPSSTTIIKLSDFFNVSTDYLLGRSNVKATQAEVDFLNEIKEKGIDQLIRDYNLTLGDKAMDPKEERILIKLIKSFVEHKD